MEVMYLVLYSISGIRVRVVLVAIIADHPAMCKICGFADHAHNTDPCTKCTVPHDRLFSDKSLRNGNSQ
jgi:predicted Zn-ribbon and HTH transcriptional regulator